MSGFFLTRKKLTFRNMLERLEITKNSKAFDQGLQIDQKLFALHNVQHLFDKHSVMSHFYRQRRTILVALLGKFPWLSLKTFNNDIFSIGVNASKKFSYTHRRHMTKMIATILLKIRGLFNLTEFTDTGCLGVCSISAPWKCQRWQRLHCPQRRPRMMIHILLMTNIWQS